MQEFHEPVWVAECSRNLGFQMVPIDLTTKVPRQNSTQRTSASAVSCSQCGQLFQCCGSRLPWRQRSLQSQQGPAKAERVRGDEHFQGVGEGGAVELARVLASLP